MVTRVPCVLSGGVAGGQQAHGSVRAAEVVLAVGPGRADDFYFADSVAGHSLSRPGHFLSVQQLRPAKAHMHVMNRFLLAGQGR